jgi:multidrug transporter EmrE-like cation transporter
MICYDIMKLLFITIIFIASILEYFGDSNFKFYARTGADRYLAYGLAAYLAMIYVLIQVLKISNVMYMNLSWDAISAIIETVLAYVLLGERLSNGYQIGGFVLIIMGIVLLNVGAIPL